MQLSFEPAGIRVTEADSEAFEQLCSAFMSGPREVPALQDSPAPKATAKAKGRGKASDTACG